MNLESLNENQRLAVMWDDGPLLVLAGPGSGKTLVLTLRAARLLKANPDSSILALTFTTKAADEMRERLDKLMGGRAERAHLCTFHSFAADILRQHGNHIGIRPDFSLLTTDEDRIAILEDSIKQLGLGSTIPTDRRSVISLIDRLFADSYSGEPVAPNMAITPPWVPQLFKTYCNSQILTNKIDFGGLLYFARVLLMENAGVARLTQIAWEYIAVDEFQDTNKAQYDFLTLLANGERPNLFVVADDDQIIYQWNGASPERLFSLRSDFQMDVVQLPENFRCPPAIIEVANALIQKNTTRTKGKQPLVARKPPQQSRALLLQVFEDENLEIETLPITIRSANWSPEHCAVIARNTKLLEKAARALQQSGFNTFLNKRKTEFESPAVSWLYSALRLANARHDREFLRRICVTWRSYADVLIEPEDVEAQASLEGGDFLRSWIRFAIAKGPGAKDEQLLKRCLDALVDRLDYLSLLEWFWSQRWLNDDIESEEIATWQDLHASVLRDYTASNATLHLYLQEMDLKSKAPAQTPGSIRCLTVHGSKGMEFKHVILIGMADEVFPSYQAVSKGAESKEMEEERRNCFVAITRAEETLYVSLARRYNGYLKRPSRFLSEMGFKISEYPT